VALKHLTAARRLGLEAVAAEVVGAFRLRGVRAIVFKGPALDRWLYGGNPHPYVDVDLIVSPADFDAAEATLAVLGFEMPLATARPEERLWQEHCWRRGTFLIDLHRSLLGAYAPPEAVWEALSQGTETIEVAGAPIEIPSEPAQALIAALHAAWHGPTRPAALEDLRRALEQAPVEAWQEAAGLARRLDALGGFAVGLGLLPAGAGLLRRLDVDTAVPIEVHLRAQGAPRIALGVQRLAAASTLGARVALLASALVPTPPALRDLYPFARKGRLGLLAAYAWRPLSLCLQTPGALRAVRNARRRARPG
jgi:putative nucleotidyltransferase-like protein